MKIFREELPPKANPGEWVAIDVEMFGMNPKLLHRPTTGRFACITICMEHDPDTVYFSTSEVSPMAYLSAINDGVWVFQHAKFDIMQLRRYAHITPRSKLWDTMLIEQIQYHGYYDTFSLADLARRYLGIKLDKSLQKSFGDDTGEMTEDQIQYACRDTYYTLQVALHQRKNISKNDFKIWKEIELPFLWALLDFRGFRVDRDAWQQMSNQHQQKAETLKKLFFEMTGILPDSHRRVAKYLASKGFKKLPNSQAETIEKYLEKYPDVSASEPAKVLLEYKQYSKMASTYGISLLENYLEEESPGVWVVYGDYKQIGAETSRTSCTDPNIQNIPNKQEFRSKFIARPGNKLIIADFSQQEPCISTYLSQDENLFKVNKSGEDVYIGLAKIFFNDTITKKDPRRKTMKSVYLGLSYGLSAYGLAKKEKIDVDDAKKLIDRFFKIFSGFGKWSKRQRTMKKFVTTVPGRKVWLNPYSNQSERNALNAPHQGTGSEQMKKSIAVIHQKWQQEVIEKLKCKYPFAIVAEVHDEFILDVPENYAKDIADFVQKEAVQVAEAMCKGVSFRVGVEIGDSWNAKT